MKNILLSFLLIWVLPQIGLSQKSKRPSYFLHFHGALLFDSDPRNDYLGINFGNVGWAKFKERSLTGIDIEFISYKSKSQKKSNTSFLKNRTSFEAYFFRSYALQGNMDNGLFVGPSISIFFSKTHLSPGSFGKSKVDEICQCAGLGGKIDYLRKLNRKTHLHLSTRFTLLDVGNFITQGYHPLLPLSAQREKGFSADFLRNQFQLMVGVSFKL